MSAVCSVTELNIPSLIYVYLETVSLNFKWVGLLLCIVTEAHTPDCWQVGRSNHGFPDVKTS